MSEIHMVVCDGCERHVRADEPECPFCGAHFDASRPMPGRPSQRLSRAATFAFGAALAAATATGCSDSHEGGDSGPDDDAGAVVDAGQDAGVDSGAVAPPYGTPPEDAGFAPLYGGAPPEE